jgi:hypothetical protein
MSPDLAASVRARLLKLAKAEGSDFQAVLVRYALERLLYRLSLSAHAERFVLKGALLFALWYDMPHRPTRDADLLSFGPSDLASIHQIFCDITGVAVADGIVFDPHSIRTEEIRHDAAYAGARVTLIGELARARCTTQVDIGFGDAITPGPVRATYPVLLHDFPAPSLNTYPAYTVIAEKLHAIALLGMTNTRLKDYLDLQVLLTREQLSPETLAQAIAATFMRRGMAVPPDWPLGLSDEFGHDATRLALWRAFLRKNTLVGTPLPELLQQLRCALTPAWQQAARPPAA